MPFEEWAYLIEIENNNENFIAYIDGSENEEVTKGEFEIFQTNTFKISE